MEGGGMDHKEVIVMCELPGCMGLIPGAGGASKAVVPERAAEVVKGPGRLGGTRGGRPGSEDSGVEGDVGSQPWRAWWWRREYGRRRGTSRGCPPQHLQKAATPRATGDEHG